MQQSPSTPRTVLALDPCGERCAAGLYAIDAAGARLLGEAEAPGGPAAAAGAAGAACAGAFDAAGLGWGDIARIVVARGPGGFSALRAGLAFALGAAAARRLAIVGVSRFAALHHAHPDCAALLDAGRGGIYARRADSAERVGPPEEIAAWLADPTTPLCGPAASAVAQAGGGVVRSAAPPSLATLAVIGCARPAEAGVAALYIRPPAVTPAAADAAAHIRSKA